MALKNKQNIYLYIFWIYESLRICLSIHFKNTFYHLCIKFNDASTSIFFCGQIPHKSDDLIIREILCQLNTHLKTGTKKCIFEYFIDLWKPFVFF